MRAGRECWWGVRESRGRERERGREWRDQCRKIEREIRRDRYNAEREKKREK